MFIIILFIILLDFLREARSILCDLCFAMAYYGPQSFSAGTKNYSLMGKAAL